MTRRIILATGGTAGHVYPALAVADAFRVQRPSVEIGFIGSSQGFEERLVTAAGYPFHCVESLPLAMVGTRERAQALARFFGSVGDATAELRREPVRLAIGFGGHASAATIVSARRLGIPTAILECNAQPGLANLLLIPFAQRIFTVFSECNRFFPRRRVRHCGLPLRSTACVSAQKLPASPDVRQLLVVGGSGGTAFLNRRAPEVVAALARRGKTLEVLHQCGSGHVESTRAAYRAAGVEASVHPYIEDMGSAYAWADFALASAGASTLMELASNAVPMLVVPEGKMAMNHHEANARAFSRVSGSPWIREEEWQTEQIAERLLGWMTDRQGLHQWRHRLVSISPRDAASAIITHCDELLVD